MRVSFELLPGVEVLAVLEELSRHGLQHEFARRLERLVLLVPLLWPVLLLPALRLGLLLGLGTGLGTSGLRGGEAADRAAISELDDLALEIGTRVHRAQPG